MLDPQAEDAPAETRQSEERRGGEEPAEGIPAITSRRDADGERALDSREADATPPRRIEPLERRLFNTKYLRAGKTDWWHQFLVIPNLIAICALLFTFYQFHHSKQSQAKQDREWEADKAQMRHEMATAEHDVNRSGLLMAMNTGMGFNEVQDYARQFEESMPEKVSDFDRMLLAQAHLRLGRRHEAVSGLDGLRHAAATEPLIKARCVVSLLELYLQENDLRAVKELLEEADELTAQLAGLPRQQFVTTLTFYAAMLAVHHQDPESLRRALDEMRTIHPPSMRSQAMAGLLPSFEVLQRAVHAHSLSEIDEIYGEFLDWLSVNVPSESRAMYQDSLFYTIY
ncbi:MAG: hypothetical protein RLY93_00615 [Sumerlaeia bacterium]